MRTEPATPARLAARATGAGRPVALVHGFAQTGGCWGPLAEALAADRRVVAVDLPGHGGSARHATADLDATSELLAATVCPAGPAGRAAPCDWVGYSLGARAVLTLAVRRPEVVGRVVLVSGTAGLADPAERAARVAADEALAAGLERDGLDAFLDRWLALPLFAGLAPWARFDAERRTNTAAGLAASLRRAGTGAMTPLWDRLGGLAGTPVLVVTGADDAKFDQLGQRLAAGIGASARHLAVPGAGHATHLEAPATVSAAVRAFLADDAPPAQAPTNKPNASSAP